LDDAYTNRGNLYADKGEKDLALNDYNQAIKLNPQLAELVSSDQSWKKLWRKALRK
jgi:lipoprotein NlpI